MTSCAPNNTSELQLYRVLQRANLLHYYDTFIQQGGDDVQQLCEAGEEEFLEIMALVGMASKPLHVRRLQKALQEWVVNPSVFQQPLTNAAAAGSIAASVRLPCASVVSATTWSPAAPNCNSPPMSITPPIKEEVDDIDGLKSMKLTPIYKVNTDDVKAEYSDMDTLTPGQRSSTSPVPTPCLVDHQVMGLSEAAECLVQTLPRFEAKPMNMKKQINKDIEDVMKLPMDYPGRMTLVRKYASIYGRFDSKRKNDRPMSLHEISVNEASAQLCKHIPSLLTRREELFPLARQVVRDSGYQYSKGHSRATMVGENLLKKPRLDSMVKVNEQTPKVVRAEIERIQREDRIHEINTELNRITEKQEEIKASIQTAKADENYALIQSYQAQLEPLTLQQLALLTEQSEIMKKQRKCVLKYKQTKGGATNGSNHEEDVDSLASGSCSPQGHGHDEDSLDVDFTKQDYYVTPPKKSISKTRQFVQESLFDEGLRIAQQYGMADFATELIGLKQTSVDSDEDEERDESELTIDSEVKTDDLDGEERTPLENTEAISESSENYTIVLNNGAVGGDVTTVEEIPHDVELAQQKSQQ